MSAVIVKIIKAFLKQKFSFLRMPKTQNQFVHFYTIAKIAMPSDLFHYLGVLALPYALTVKLV